jgi:hypothetical protein
VPAWKPYVHPADRGWQVLVGGDTCADVVRAAGHAVEQAPHKGPGGMPVPGAGWPPPQVYWTTPEGIDEAELLTILNRCMRVSYTTALGMLRGLQELAGWPDVVAELRTCYRFGSGNDTLRSIIATLTQPAQETHDDHQSPDR